MRIALMLLWQPVLLRRTMGRPWIQWLMLAVAAALASWAMLGELKPAAVLACLVGAGQLMAWWGLYVICIGLAYAQRDVRLAPQLRRSVLATTTLVWLCLVMIATLVGGGLFGHHALWALMAGLVLAGLALFIGGRGEGLLFIAPATALAVAPMRLIGSSIVVWIEATLATPAGMAGGAALLGVSMCYTLRHLLGARHGDRLNGNFQRLWSATASGARPTQGALKGPVAALYARSLRHDCARRDSQPLLIHALGPSLHWSVTLSGLFPTLLVGATYYLGLRLHLFPELDAAILTGISVGTMISSQYVLQMGGARIAAGQPEQALLRLVPGMPMANALNRMLARGLLGLFFKNWLATMGVLALLLALMGIAQTRFIELMSSLSMTVLLAAGLLRDYALANKGRERLFMALLFLLMTSLMLAILLAPMWFALFDWPQLPAYGIGLSVAPIVMLLTGLIVLWRWRAMLAAPPAFPAGRI